MFRNLENMWSRNADPTFLIETDERKFVEPKCCVEPNVEPKGGAEFFN